MSALANQLQPLFERLPEDKREARRAFWERLQSEGFPDNKHERWRFTDIAAAVAEQPTAPQPTQLDLPRIEGLRRVGFVNGIGQDVDTGEQLTAPATAVSDASDLVNAALAGSGLYWQPHENDSTLHLCTRSRAGSAHLRHRVVVPANAHALLYWDDIADDQADFGTQTLEVVLGENAHLALARSHRNHAGSAQLLRVEAQLAGGAHLHLTGFDTGTGLSRHNLQVNLQDAGARAVVSGIYAPYAKGHIDTFASVDHDRGETTSRMHFRGLGMEKATGLLTGRVFVARDAQKADSDQQLAGLLLSPQARINAKPELEIYADDVVCAHGNAIGQIDEDALHYLQTRGIARADARAMLVAGFAAETLAFPASEVVAAQLQEALTHALQHADWSHG